MLSGAAGSVTGSFWNIELSGAATSPGGGEPLTTAQMLNRDTFEGWSFDDDPQIWSIEQGSYPYLTWEGDNAPVTIVSRPCCSFLQFLKEQVVAKL